ncbi:hypothetical protein BCR44DRAFT_1398013 [Catenaria anguillulae PL171]|uniref:ABC transporter domain-containing protein n=1 Tax=Catenaria anguillulae PL171 TaxID=765915 RepID=A0A1Y2GZ64_9FUNG|nr:hypothetical protein BCR44DRAFT_1398013 [Catenaria anguillulae PL171]
MNYFTFNEERARRNGAQWQPIPIGKYRMFPNSELETCPLGFVCPANTTQPMYCPVGLFCPTPSLWFECPKGFFCPRSTVKPFKCHYFAQCDNATDSPTRYGIFGFVIALALFASYGFYIKSKLDARRRADKELALKKAGIGYGPVPVEEEELGIDKQHVSGQKMLFDIEFTDIGRVLPNGKAIMQRVSGKLSAGRSCAIMGPSGAGKSTLFSLLTGKAPRTSGEVKISGKVNELSKYAKLVGYVPQEDIMIRELTVSDILTHSAYMRLPADMSKDQIKDKVAQITTFLGLSHVNDSIIGTEAERGISGGQRKRVNIGMELVAEPSVLFLDEPTSGLDSSTSLDVCAQLRRIAEQQKMTVAAVIHSPSPAAFSQFHDFILLCKGGTLAYLGPRDEAPAYFESIGFKVPEGISESDFYMDVVSGVVPSSFDPNFTPALLPEYWIRHTRGEPLEIISKSSFSASGGHSDDNFLSNTWLTIVGLFTTIKEVIVEFFMWFGSLVICRTDPVRNTPNQFRVMVLCAKRAMLQVYRSLGTFLRDQGLHFMCGAFISIASSNMQYLRAQPDGVCAFAPIAVGEGSCKWPIDLLREVGIFMSVGVLFAGINVGTQTFGNELVVFWRDTASGQPTLPYFISKILVDVPRVILAAFMYSLSLILFWPYRSQYWTLYSIILALYFTAFGMGYFLSTIFRREVVGLVGTGFALAWALVLGGTTPSIAEITDPKPGNMLANFAWLWNCSSPRWAIEALYIHEVRARNYDIEIGKNHGYREGREVLAISYMTAIYFGWLVLAFLGLKLMNRDKQK